jgi:DNA-binding PadR family transcriptional regulator
MPPTRQSTAKLPLAPAVFHVLLALADGDAHGYRIRAAVIEASNGALVLDPGSLYRLIARLHEDDLIEDAPAGSRSTRDEERVRRYRLTPEGRRVLKAETQRMSALVSLVRTRTLNRGGHA